MDTTHASPSGWLRAAVRPLVTLRGGTTLLHHLLGLPLGVAYLVWLLTGLSLGAGLAITLIGIPILTLVPGQRAPAARGGAGDGQRAARRRHPRHAADAGWEGSSRASRPTGPTLELAGDRVPAPPLPRRVATFTVAMAAFGAAVCLLAAPIVVPIDGDTLERRRLAGRHADRGPRAGPAGLVTLFAAGWISEGMGAASRELARWGAR